jgi:hypothetical protein
MAGQNIDLGDVVVAEVVVWDSVMQQIATLRRYWTATTLVGVGDVTFQNVATYFDTNLSAPYISVVYNGARYEGVRVRRHFPVSTDQWAYETSNAGPGTAGAVALPTQTAGLLRFQSAEIGKKGQGRQYVPFPSASDNETIGEPTAAYQAAVSNIGTVLAQPQTIAGGGTKSYVFKPTLWNEAGSVGTEIITFLVAPSWATQKRRGAYGRTNKVPF